LRVVQITDNHLSERENGDLLGMNTDDSLNLVLDLVAGQSSAIDLFLATGDISDNGSVQAYSRFRQRIGERFPVPFAWLPGNHDLLSNMQQVTGQGDELSKVIVAGNWQIILLNSAVEGKVHGHLAQQELDVLQQALTDHPERHSLVFLHHHPVLVGCAWLDTQIVNNASAFYNIIHRAGNVKAVICGHVHQQFESQETVPMLSTPSTCVQFKPGSDDFALDNLMPGYRWFDLYPDGRFETAVERIDHYEFDIDLQSKGY